jgi:hypothetical protein
LRQLVGLVEQGELPVRGVAQGGGGPDDGGEDVVRRQRRAVRRPAVADAGVVAGGVAAPAA